MINNVNQTLVALMGKNSKKAGSTDTNTDAFQALLATLMSQGMNMQGNNMSELEGELQGQLVDMLSANGTGMNTTDVFGINQSLMRMLSGQGNGTGSMQGDANSLEGFEELMKGFISEAGQQTGAIEVNPQTAVQENATITQEIMETLTALKEKAAQASQSEQGIMTAPISEEAPKAAVTSSANNKATNDVGQQNTELKAKTVEKQGDNQFIVTRPEILRILKGDTAKTDSKSEGINIQSVPETKVQNQDAIQGIAQKTELSTEQNSEEKGEMPEQKLDGSIQTDDMRNLHITRIQDAPFEVKQPSQINREDVIGQVIDKVKLINGKDTSELHISLKPETLGEVSIKLVMEKGAMTAKITVESSQVKSLIDSNLPQIKESLKSQNIEVTSLNVSVNLGQGDLSNNQDFNFHRWTFNKKGNTRTGSLNGDSQVEAVKPREIYTQRSGLNLYA